jgi:predicted RND superfamily exporter protein
MLTLVNLLIIFFIVLILYQIFLAYFENSIMEGYENKDNKDYKQYDTNNPDNALILAQQNAGNIEVLKGQLDNMLGINQEVQDLSGNVVRLQQQVDDLVQAQNDYANDLTGGVEPEITGTGEEGEEEITETTEITETV